MEEAEEAEGLFKANAVNCEVDSERRVERVHG